MEQNTWNPLPLLNSYLDYWAAKTPEAPAMIQFETGEEISYRQFAERVENYALTLIDLGITKGDMVATMLLEDIDHICLMYACSMIGAIIAPLDVRLKETEVVRDLEKIQAKIFFFLGNTPIRDFTLVGKAVKENCSYTRHLVEISARTQAETSADGFTSFSFLKNADNLSNLKSNPELVKKLKELYSSLDTKDGCLIIFTTGTTGEPKPALLNHECIIAQDEILARIVDLPREDLILLCNMPPSHVAGTTEAPFTTFYAGGTAVLVQLFTPQSTLEAIQKHRVTAIGMVPTQYRMLWALPNYADYDLSSLKVALYGGAAVDLPFLTEMAKMADVIGGGLGMTESAGWATCHPKGIKLEEMVGQVGQAFPDVAKVSVRKPMNEDGTAGEELPDGETGEICYHPPLVFPGYYNMPEETAKTVSTDGILYTGDLGTFKDMGSYRGLIMSGRRKFMIKQKGYNVSPEEVEAHIALYPKVAEVYLVGCFHRVFDEGIFAFVKPRPGVEISEDEIMQHCKDIAAYKRPQHVEIWPADELFPMNRLNKIERQTLKTLAEDRVKELREQGKWDA